MPRDKEKKVGFVLQILGIVALAVPILSHRRLGLFVALLTAGLTGFPGLLMLRAGSKLRKKPPRREITVDELRENAKRYRFWNRLKLE